MKQTPKVSRTRLIVARVLVILGILLGIVSIYANFVKREALDSGTFRKTSNELIANEAIRDQVAATAVDLLYQNVDVAAELEAKLPENLQGLSGPIAGAARELANRAATEALSRPIVQAAFVEAASASQRQVVEVLDGNVGALTTSGGNVVLDLRPVVLRLGDRFSFVSNLSERVPQDAAQVTILQSDQLGTAQDLTQVLKVVADWIWIPMMALWAVAVWLVPGRRRQEVRAIAIGFVVVGLAVVALRGVIGGYLVDHLVASDSVRPAVEAFWSILTASLVAAGWLVFATGVLATAGLWLAGPSRQAYAARGWLAPYLQRADIAWIAFVLLLLLFFWVAPTTRFSFVLIVTVPAIVGFELLRRQVALEHPDADSTEPLRAWRGWRDERKARRAAPAGAAPTASPPSATDELERLATLHASGALTDAEFASAKAKALGPT